MGYIVALWRGWDMALVMVGTLPFLAAVGAVLAKMSTVFNQKNTAAYAEASEVAQQSISQVWTWHGPTWPHTLGFTRNRHVNKNI